jgi:hypothetical protein
MSIINSSLITKIFEFLNCCQESCSATYIFGRMTIKEEIGMMTSESMRLRKIQRLAHEIMDEVNLRNVQMPPELLTIVIDNLSRAVGDLTDPSGNFSLSYLEEKVGNAHSLLVKKR